ncbi:uncharacterized protein [Nicotiana tomentosiformis]|uniref:uncharacterized protein n=1 Tax=Nicotiana tomentosiformis TaxID=4098 RepID=UPI00388C9946
MAFLGHVVSSEGIKVDLKKTEAIQSWLRPSSATEIMSFLGLAGYYLLFVEGFSSIIAPDQIDPEGCSVQVDKGVKANVVADAVIRKVESLGSLVYLPAVDRPLTLDVQALANQFVRLDVLELSRVLTCMVSRSSLNDRIRERKYDDPYLLVLKDTVQHGDAKEVTIEDDSVLQMQGRLFVPNVDGLLILQELRYIPVQLKFTNVPFAWDLHLTIQIIVERGGEHFDTLKRTRVKCIQNLVTCEYTVMRMGAKRKRSWCLVYNKLLEVLSERIRHKSKPQHKHPQTDGQAERTIQTLEDRSWCLVYNKLLEVLSERIRHKSKPQHKHPQTDGQAERTIQTLEDRFLLLKDWGRSHTSH